ncbi:MAG: hypothetical protein V4666_03705 [Bacteroidota bacterium]
MEAKYKIGYIDEDVRQVSKYNKRFREYGIEIIGYEFHKGMTIEELMSQVYNSKIDLLMIDYKLDESSKVMFNGEAVEREIYDKKPLFPHIIFTNKVEDAEHFVEDWKIIFSKDYMLNKNDEDYDEEDTKYFITILEKSIEQYRSHIQRRKNEISYLLEKGKKEKLLPEEKHNLMKLQKELKVLDNSNEVEVPEYLLISENLTEVENLKTEAEEFLNQLIEKRKK